MNMTKTRSELQVEHLNSELQKRDDKIIHLSQENQNLNQENQNLKEQLEWFKRQIFGKRSERVVSNLNHEQLEFDGFENIGASTEIQKKTVASHTRSKPNRNGQDKIALPSDLPVKTIILDIPEEEKVCKETGKPLVQIGVEITHKLAHEPGSYYVKEIIRPKYVNPQKEETGVLTAELPDTLLPKCRADESLLAEIITQKFADHLPLYRIAESMEREGIKISRKLLSQWVIKCGMALKPLYDEMLSQILTSKNIFIDESPVKLWEPEKCKQAYMWVVVGGSEADPLYRVYQFKKDRCHDNVLDILKDYRGGLHSDKYGAYQRLAERKIITWYPCWSHIRRKFFDAEAGDSSFRQWVLRKIRYLFMLERVAWARAPEERLRIRQEKEIPIIDELIDKIKSKFMDGKNLPKSKLKEAMGYFCSLIPYLKNYTQDPFAKLDNNVAERAIRPLAIGRKNWLFFGSPDGGEAGAILFSLVQTCRGLGINPREYLEDVMRRLMGHNNLKLHELLPDEWLKNRNQKPVS
jgi:transposase